MPSEDAPTPPLQGKMTAPVLVDRELLGKASVARANGDQLAAEHYLAQFIAANTAPRAVSEALGLMAAMQKERGRLDLALATAEKAVAADTTYPRAHSHLATLLMDHYHERERAIAHLHEAARHDPKNPQIIAPALYLKRMDCDWSNYEAMERIEAQILDLKPEALSPFHAIAAGIDDAGLLRVARPFADAVGPVSGKRSPLHAPIGGPLTIGCLSSDLRAHAAGYQLPAVLEALNPERVRLIAYATRPDDGSPLAARLRRSFHLWRDASAMSNQDLAQRIRDDHVDIVFDLNGVTDGGRPAVLAAGPAAITVTTGVMTTGGSWMDYAFADPIAIPYDCDHSYTEAIVRLGCVMMVDDKPEIAPDTPSRAEQGLDPDDIVFASFNQGIKINPNLFSAWMRILREVPEGVLWLTSHGDRGNQNLTTRMVEAGLDPARLRFARVTPTRAHHLARLGVADIALDTRPFNGHTTTCDALFVGLPVVTCSGSAMPGRYAASIVHAAGLPELVAPDIDSYVQLAVALAKHRHRRLEMRHWLLHEGRQSRLFDPRRMAREMEQAFTKMANRARRNLRPVPFDILDVNDE